MNGFGFQRTKGRLAGLGFAAIAVVAAIAVTGGVAAGTPAGSYRGDRAETERFLSWYGSIELTAEQESTRVQALAELPAPCCREYSAATCCCSCNMARAGWGLAKHLIVEQGATAEQVRAEVAAWHRAINPGGFSGDACFTGGCGRPFAKNGCGGMKETELVF
ncbi:MAG TPA: hypothetical protein VLA66_03440 [Thermoanaerobaculia bacterium]|nr:hypothetical protein [Thermoanaerobaculia bacterium]